jgi:hypothetical protein
MKKKDFDKYLKIILLKRDKYLAFFADLKDDDEKLVYMKGMIVVLKEIQEKYNISDEVILQIEESYKAFKKSVKESKEAQEKVQITTQKFEESVVRYDEEIQKVYGENHQKSVFLFPNSSDKKKKDN